MNKILAIDDKNSNLFCLKATIEDAFPDTIIYTALNGTQGMEMAIAEDPDVILLDVLMPEMDGYEVCRQLKQDIRTQDIPVIFLTIIQNDKDSRIRALEVGGEAFLSKPIDVAELTTQIRVMAKMKLSNRQKQYEQKQLAKLVAERTHALEQNRLEMIKLLEELRAENEAHRNTLKILSESEHNYRYMFDNNPQPMWIYDLETLAFVLVNNAALKLYGYSREEFLSMTLIDILSDEDVKTLKSDIGETNRDLNSLRESRQLKKNGELVYVEIISHSVTCNDRPARHAMVNDITIRKRAEEEIRTLSKAIEQSPASIIITDAQGKIQFVNVRYSSIMQYSPEEVKGYIPRIFNPAYHSHEKLDAIWNTLQYGKIWQSEFQNKKKDGTCFWENVIISPLLKEDGITSNYIIISEDITEKKAILVDLIAAKEKAEESDRLKTAFLQNISHETRTPMNAIMGFSELINDPTLLPEERKQYTDIIRQNSDQLLSVITDIVNIAMVESGQEKVIDEMTNLNSLCSNLISRFAAKAMHQNIILRHQFYLADNESDIIIDQTKLTRILHNLISNAIKFTKQGIVEFGYKIKEDKLEFYVKDTGIGIPMGMKDEIFKCFHQVENTLTRQFGGSGLGLAITKAYVELMGGAIWLTSEMGKGSVFYFTLPLKFPGSNLFKAP
ncbi:MAG: PAS domain S-box protein [Bacteroidota bacterium]|nr:PAS domain S-box protein [Bacteroidota bacterium]